MHDLDSHMLCFLARRSGVWNSLGAKFPASDTGMGISGTARTEFDCDPVVGAGLENGHDMV